MSEYTHFGILRMLDIKIHNKGEQTVKKKIYGEPEIKISCVLCDIITQSRVEDYNETEEWDGPGLPMGDN